MQKTVGLKLKFVEKAGTPFGDLLCKKNPWAGKDCSRESCLICEEGKKNPNCKRRNLTYQNTCQLCLKDGRSSIYIGESSRSFKERMGDHYRDVKTKEDCHMRHHAVTEHEGKVDFKAKVRGFYRSAFVQ